MTDLDQRIASVLRERAEGETDTHRLLRDSRALGRRRQLRRRAATGTALALVGVLGAVGVTGTDLTGLPGRLPWTAATPAVAAPVPPRADGAPAAATDPARIGTDPQVLHFGVDPAQARYLGWSASGAQVEEVRLEAVRGVPVRVQVTRSAEAFDGLYLENFPNDVATTPPRFDGAVREVRSPLRPAGSPAASTGGLVKAWQPVPGVYARAAMLGYDRDAFDRSVAALRWDEARRCVAPLRLTDLPPGATIGGCTVNVAGFPGGIDVELTLRRGESSTMWVRLQYAVAIAGSRTDGNRTVDGRPAYLYPDGDKLELLGIPKTHLIADFRWPGKGFTETDAATVLAGARVAKDLTRPETWD
ncbi:hypothetical protein [Micromonospora inositola]|uniref:Uncharacterized protein n=1 Tax=Micromonospora inositola TaxID=47865 RepID=A0A1C5IK57_9ACTN|nr:hypothetical protein [Micromonospora inositola]SCG58738.1 hypothetical protein GA0070613_2997 [Micromonospora inositola]